MWSILSLKCPPPFQIPNSSHMYKTALIGLFSVLFGSWTAYLSDVAHGKFNQSHIFINCLRGENSNGQWNSIPSDSWISQSYLDLDWFVWGNRKLETGPSALTQASTSALLELGTENLILIWTVCHWSHSQVLAPPYWFRKVVFHSNPQFAPDASDPDLESDPAADSDVACLRSVTAPVIRSPPEKIRRTSIFAGRWMHNE